MKLKKPRIFMILFCLLILMFLSNDFGIIDIEKTAIVTAVAVDLLDDEYSVSVQISVPEATDSNTENQKALLTGSGSTVGGAIKDIGNVSGWFPKLSFCNLIILGSSFKDENVIETLDYFAKTLRIQDSAVVCFAEKTAKEVLDTASPLDNISSFAIQKVLLKDAGLDRDIATNDIRKFAIGYYDRNSFSYMPIAKIIPQSGGGDSSGASGGDSQGGSQSGGQFGNKGQSLYDLSNTALFLNGRLKGVLDTPLTFTFKMLSSDVKESLLHLENADDEGANYSLTLLRNTPKISMDFKDGYDLNINLNIYCKVSDVKKPNTDSTYASNKTLPPSVKKKAEELLKGRITKLFNMAKTTGCDILGLDNIMYKYHHKKYAEYKNDLYNCDLNISVTFTAQK